MNKRSETTIVFTCTTTLKHAKTEQAYALAIDRLTKKLAAIDIDFCGVENEEGEELDDPA